MTQVVAQPTVEVLGDVQQLKKALADGLSLLNSFAQSVDKIGKNVNLSLNKMTDGLSGKIATLDARITTLDNMVKKFETTVQGASAALQTARQSVDSFRSDVVHASGDVNTAASQMAQGATKAFTDTAKSADNTGTRLARLATNVRILRNLALRPIQFVIGKGGGGGGKAGIGGNAGAFGLSLAGGAVIEFFKKAVDEAQKFDDALHKLYATAGEKMPFDQLKAQVLSIANAFGQLPADVANALYPIASLGYSDADALKVLANAMNLAKGSQSDAIVTANLLAKSLYAYGQGADKAYEMTDILTRAVKDSDQPARDFGAAMLTVVKPASMLGISFQEAASSLAMNINTTKNAARGATQLIALFTDLVHPTAAQRKEAHLLGLEWMATGHAVSHIKEVGWERTLNEINTATKGQAKTLGDLFPDMRKIGGAYGLLNQVGRKYADVLKDVTNSSGAADKASSEMNKSFGQAQRNFEAGWKTFQITLGDALKPIGTKGLNLLTQLFTIIEKIPKPVLAAVAAFVAFGAAASVAVGFWAFAGEAIMAVAGPVAAIGAAVALIAIAWKTNFLNIQGVTRSVLSWLGTAIHTAAVWIVKTWLDMSDSVKTYWASISPEVKEVLDFIYNYIKSTLSGIKLVWGPTWDGFVLTLRVVWDILSGVLKIALTNLLGDIKIFLDVVTGHWKKAWTDLTNMTDTMGSELLDTFKNIFEDLYKAEIVQITKMTVAWQTFLDTIKSTGSYEAALNAAGIASDIAGSTMSGLLNQPDGPNLAKVQADVRSINVPSSLSRASCAYFASEYLQKQGIKVPTIVGAQDFANFAKTHGEAVPLNQVQANDLLVYNGPGYGSIQKGGRRSGYHVGVAVGGGLMAQSNDARNSVGPIQAPADRKSSVTAYRLNNEGVAEHAVDEGVDLFSYYKKNLMAALGIDNQSPLYPKGKNYGDSSDPGKSGKGKSPIFLAEPSQLNLGAPGTAAGDKYKAIMDYVHGLGDAADKTRNETAYAKELAQVQKQVTAEFANNGLAVNEHAMKIALDSVKIKYLTLELNRVSGALGTVNKDLPVQATWLTTLKGKYETAKKAAQDFYTPNKGKLARADEPAKEKHKELSDTYRDAQQKYLAFEGHMQRLTTHSQTAAAAQKNLQQQIDATNSSMQSQVTAWQQSAGSFNRELQGAVRGATDKDDIASRLDEIHQKAQEMREDPRLIELEWKKFNDALEQGASYADALVAALDPLKDISTYEAASSDKVMSEVEGRIRKEQQDLQKFLLDTGQETIAQYQSAMQGMLHGMITEFENTGFSDVSLATDIETLANNLQKMGWQDINDALTGLKESLDSGDISAQQYIADLQKVMSLPGFRQSPEYKKATSALDTENRKQAADQIKQADKIGKTIGDPIAQGILDALEKKGNSLKESLRKIAQEALEKSFKSAAEKLVSGFALKELQKHNTITNDPSKSDGMLFRELNKKQTGQEQFNAAVNKWTDGSTTLMLAMKDSNISFQNAINMLMDYLSGRSSGPGSSYGTSSSGGGFYGTGLPSSPLDTANKALNASNRVLTSIDSIAKTKPGAIGSAVSDVSQIGGDVSSIAANARGGISGAIGAAGAINDLAKAAGSIGKVSALSKFAAAAGPWIGAIGAVVALAGMFGGSGKQTPSLLHDEVFSKVFASLGSTIDSGKSGAEGMRQLLGSVSASSAGVHGLAVAPTTIHINGLELHAHGVEDPVAFAQKAAPALMNEIARVSYMDNARRGGGYNVPGS